MDDKDDVAYRDRPGWLLGLILLCRVPDRSFFAGESPAGFILEEGTGDVRPEWREGLRQITVVSSNGFSSMILPWPYGHHDPQVIIIILAR